MTPWQPCSEERATHAESVGVGLRADRLAHTEDQQKQVCSCAVKPHVGWACDRKARADVTVYYASHHQQLQLWLRHVSRDRHINNPPQAQVQASQAPPSFLPNRDT